VDPDTHSLIKAKVSDTCGLADFSTRVRLLKNGALEGCLGSHFSLPLPADGAELPDDRGQLSLLFINTRNNTPNAGIDGYQI
jgi:hypothetical protein